MKKFACLCFIYSSTLSFPQFFVIMKLNGTNYKNEKNKLSDNHYMNVCFESNTIDVPFDTWWLDVVLPFTLAILCKR